MKLKFVSLTVILLFSMTFSACESYQKRQIEKDAEILITQIEAFKKDNGRLPETLMEIGKKQEELDGPFTYYKKSPTRYTLGALLSMNSSYNYDSDTKQWTRKP